MLISLILCVVVVIPMMMTPVIYCLQVELFFLQLPGEGGGGAANIGVALRVVQSQSVRGSETLSGTHNDGYYFAILPSLFG